ncbi:hypothetical protein LAZ67_19001878 [Cordylochernes scorpioides]|uniref:Gag-like protein n=1 Tax=Cordylochernes scorpioides TaxID=51811 RepID=A0ABY6LMU3_9ARAC|nr:hypothetical protein LAZ67_19001878 [Cordylochernes scorpioides]
MTLAESHPSSKSADAISVPQTPMVTEVHTKEPEPGRGKPSTRWADLVEQGKQLPMEEQDDSFILVSHEQTRSSEIAAEEQSKMSRVQPVATKPTVPPLRTSPEAKSAVGQVDQCVYLEFSPEFSQAQYFMALEAKLGKAYVHQLSKMEGHILRRNVFVTDADMIAALKPYGRVTSIVQQMMELENSCWADTRREAFITLPDGDRFSEISARLIIRAKGFISPVYVSYGNCCSLCHWQGHKRANCPQKTGDQRHFPGRRKRPRCDDASLTHRYWSCRAVRPLPREVFASCEVPLDLQAWLFGVGLHPEAMKLTSVAKATIYKYHLGLEVGDVSYLIDLSTL